jgi:hypothetical protein
MSTSSGGAGTNQPRLLSRFKTSLEGIRTNDPTRTYIAPSDYDDHVGCDTSGGCGAQWGQALLSNTVVSELVLLVNWLLLPRIQRRLNDANLSTAAKKRMVSRDLVALLKYLRGGGIAQGPLKVTMQCVSTLGTTRDEMMVADALLQALGQNPRPLWVSCQMPIPCHVLQRLLQEAPPALLKLDIDVSGVSIDGVVIANHPTGLAQAICASPSLETLHLHNLKDSNLSQGLTNDLLDGLGRYSTSTTVLRELELGGREQLPIAPRIGMPLALPRLLQSQTSNLRVLKLCRLHIDTSTFLLPNTMYRYRVADMVTDVHIVEGQTVYNTDDLLRLVVSDPMQIAAGAIRVRTLDFQVPGLAQLQAVASSLPQSVFLTTLRVRYRPNEYNSPNDVRLQWHVPEDNGTAALLNIPKLLVQGLKQNGSLTVLEGRVDSAWQGHSIFSTRRQRKVQAYLDRNRLLPDVLGHLGGSGAIDDPTNEDTHNEATEEDNAAPLSIAPALFVAAIMAPRMAPTNVLRGLRAGAGEGLLHFGRAWSLSPVVKRRRHTRVSKWRACKAKRG